MNFDKHTAGLLNALGYTCAKFEATWEDVGGPESGPKIAGGPAYDEWTRPNADGTSEHVIIVSEGEIVEICDCPINPFEDYADIPF